MASRQHPGGQLHGLRGDAVADGQLHDPGRTAVGQVGQHLVPVAGRSGPVAWARSPTTVIEPFSERRGDHAQLHGREVLHLVDDDVAVGADVVVARRLTPRVGRGPSSARGLVEQRHVGVGPAHIVDTLGSGVGAGGPARRRSASGGRPGAAGPWSRTGRASSSAGVSTGHIHSSAARTSSVPRRRSAHLLGLGAVARRLAASASNTARSTKRRAALWRRKRRRAPCTIRALSSAGQPQGGQAVADDEVLAQRPLPVAHRLGHHRRHADVALDLRRLGPPRWPRRARRARGRPAPPAPPRPRPATAAPARCSAGTAGWARPPARPGPRAGSGGCRAGRRRGGGPPPSCRCPGRPAPPAPRPARSG